MDLGEAFKQEVTIEPAQAGAVSQVFLCGRTKRLAEEVSS
jgi:hypothetical protein